MLKSSRLFFAYGLFGIIPLTRGFWIKRALLRWCGATIGSNVRIVSSARFQITGALVLGQDTWVGHEVLIVGGDADVVIGMKVDIGPRTTIVTGSHELLTGSARAAGQGCSLSVIIQDGVWLGAASTILGGVTVGKCSMVAAGALVNRDVSAGTLVGGVPARLLRSLSEPAEP